MPQEAQLLELLSCHSRVFLFPWGAPAEGTDGRFPADELRAALFTGLSTACGLQFIVTKLLEARGAAKKPVDAKSTLAALALIESHFHDSVGNEGFLDFTQMFAPVSTILGDNSVASERAVQMATKSHKKIKIKLEICSGTGDWVCAQASADTDAHWVALELRHDRAYNILTKAIIEDIPNLSLLRGDAMRILPHIPDGSVHGLFVNYPEPPQKTGRSEESGGAVSEGAHLLDEAFFRSVGRVLTSKGSLTILTDNLWYAKLLVRVIADTAAESGLRSLSPDKCAEHPVEFSIDEVHLFRGVPGSAHGHVAESSSYFDRLWKKGKMDERYFLVLKKRKHE